MGEDGLKSTQNAKNWRGLALQGNMLNEDVTEDSGLFHLLGFGGRVDFKESPPGSSLVEGGELLNAAESKKCR